MVCFCDVYKDSVPIYANHPEGPFWEGKSGKLGKVRPLPTTSVLTKTHCGGRCIKCGADDYVVDTSAFLTSCQRTTQRSHGETVEARIPASAVSGVVHLIRNPYHNIVARFHLERRNMIREFPKLAAMFPSNATGFARWCQYLDHKYSKADKRMFNADVLQLMNDVPCRAEFFKYTQWHNLLLESAAALGFPGERPVPMLNIHYEDYANNFNQTLVSLLDFLQLPVAETQFQSFRSLPAYADHFTDRHRVAVKALIEHVASPETWKLIRHYFVHNAISASQLL